MTTTVKVHVNGKYRATVVQDDREPVIVEGNYNGGSGERSFYLPHPAIGTFKVTEQQVQEGDERAAEIHKGPYDYSQALAHVKRGARLAREGWNGKGMFIFLVPGSVFKVNREPLLSILGEGTEVTYRPHIDIKNADGSIAVWTPSVTDQMAHDWYLV